MIFLNIYTCIFNFKENCVGFEEVVIILGNISSFGIEVDLNKKDNMLVPLRLFIKNNPIGTLDDYTYVISFINNFMFKLEHLFELDINLKEFDELNLFNYIHSLGEDLYRYRLKLGDSFDDYYIYNYNTLFSIIHFT